MCLVGGGGGGDRERECVLDRECARERKGRGGLSSIFPRILHKDHVYS
jgi:hypothetical protein